MSKKNIWIPIGTAVVGLAVGIGATFAITSNAEAAKPTPTVTATVTAAPATTTADVGTAISSFINQVAPHTNINAQNLTSTITCPFVLGQPAGTTYECTLKYSDGYTSSFKFSITGGKVSIDGLK